VTGALKRPPSTSISVFWSDLGRGLFERAPFRPLPMRPLHLTVFCFGRNPDPRMRLLSPDPSPSFYEALVSSATGLVSWLGALFKSHRGPLFSPYEPDFLPLFVAYFSDMPVSAFDQPERPDLLFSCDAPTFCP